MILILNLIFTAFFSPAPQYTLIQMGKAIYTPDKIIRIEGIQQNNKNKIILKYNKDNRDLIKRGNSLYLEESEFPLFLKLFFFSNNLTSAISSEIFSNQLLLELSSAGIDIKKSTLTVVKLNGEAGISIGKNKRFTSANELVLYKDTLLPATLKLKNLTYRFYDYNKSLKPMTFPGKIDILQDSKVMETWTFYRKEYYSD